MNLFKLFFLGLILSSFAAGAQEPSNKPSSSNKGKFYFYWGWNRSTYSNSDIHFKGTNYDFTLFDVRATDKQAKFTINSYLNPLLLTIPQFNARLGYNISEHYSISLGDDHMKYLMTQNQTVNTSGNIAVTNYPKFNGNYDLSPLKLTEDFLMLQHCDGLNYLNAEFRRYDEVFNFNKIHAGDISISINEGLGIGALMPRTRATLLTNMPNHEFHFAGYGAGAVAAINIQFWKHFFVQAEYKVGFINMPDIYTTMDMNDRASQHFWFTQRNITFGWVFKLEKKKKSV